MADAFSKITSVKVPTVGSDPKTGRNTPFEIGFNADGVIPFPQVILRKDGEEHILKDDSITPGKKHSFTVKVAGSLLASGVWQVQIEGCRRADITLAGPDDWIKTFISLSVPIPTSHVSIAAGSARPPQRKAGTPVVYFGIHKHMHQPYYQAANPEHWDGAKVEIFGCRQGPYTGFVPAALWHYHNGGLGHAGLSTSWSGSLIEQLERCDRDGLCGGRFSGWNRSLRDCAALKTTLGNQRLGFSAFGFFHPLMALIPGRDIVKQIRWHGDIIRRVFGTEPLTTIFPPETAFHVRMIPHLVKAGVKATIYDSIHRFRACKNYPYAGMNEGMLPPSPADQENPPVSDWLALQNIWAGSKISPSLLRPEFVKYEDVDGAIHAMIAIPAERYIGNEDARGGFGALQYPSVLGQVYDAIVQGNSYDPRHPPFFLLHSDGDNYGGGAESYYNDNTKRLVEWLAGDSRFELTTVDDYLTLFPPDKSQAVHIEPGSWSGADNGDPQFRKWFSRYDQPYSPDLNSWAVLCALQNVVHTLEDAGFKGDSFNRAERLLLTAETSCYWYWTGQQEWDGQVTTAANAAMGILQGNLDSIMGSGRDRSGPTIFPPWVTPENPGGKTWGNNYLKDASRIGTVHTFIADVSGIKSATICLRYNGKEERIPLRNHGPYQSQTNPLAIADYCTAELPAGLGDIRYFIEATDNKGNVSKGSLERLFLG